MKIPKWMLNQTVTVRPYSGSGAYGPVYGDTQTVQARVEYSKQRTIDDEGNEVVSDTRVFFRPGVNVPSESEVIHEDTTYTVNELRKHQGLNEKSHKEAVLL